MQNQTIILKNIVNTFFTQEIINKAQAIVNDDVIKCAHSLYDFIKDSRDIRTNEEIVATLLLTAELLSKDSIVEQVR